MFVYQPIFNVLEWQNDKGAEHIISLKSKGAYDSKLRALHWAFLHNVK